MDLISKSFDSSVAKLLDTDSAIILQNIEHWQYKNQKNGKHYYDGKYWTYNSVKAFSDLFDYLTTKQISRCLDKLESNGYIVCGNYNKKGYDRTKWYSSVRLSAILPNGEMDLTKRGNGFDQMVEPIPDINTYINNILMSKIKISDHVLEFIITDKGIETKIPTDEKTYKYFKIAEAFRLLFKSNLLGLGAPTVHVDNATFKNYVTPIRLLFEKEKIEKEVLHEVYEYLGSDDAAFWKGNILSTKTLREKITKLIAQKEQVKNRKNRSNNNFSNNPGI